MSKRKKTKNTDQDKALLEAAQKEVENMPDEMFGTESADLSDLPKIDDEDLSIVKIDNQNWKPTKEDIKAWEKQMKEQAQKDPSFQPAKTLAASSEVEVQVSAHPHTKLPVYKTSEAAGMDVYANITMPIFLSPGEIRLIPTGLKVKIPEGYCIKVFARSGLALGKGIGLANGVGVIDSDYRDEIGVALINNSDKKFEIKKHDRIAQLVLEKVPQIKWNKLTNDEWEDLVENETNTREGGFGSTGV